MGRSWERERKIQEEFNKYKETHCHICQNKLYCIINKDDNPKAISKFLRKKTKLVRNNEKGEMIEHLIVECKNYKPKYKKLNYLQQL